MKILVTGIGGDIGNGIGRILKNSPFVSRLIGCDIHDNHAGRFVFDECLVVPKATAAGYAEAVQEQVARLGLDAVIATSEPELRFLAGRAAAGAPVTLPFVMANQTAMEVGFDKLATAEFIAGLGCPAPWTRLVSAGEPESLPCILKSRTGAGSLGVSLVRDPALVPAYQALFPDHIWQEYMPDDENEYTCGVYGCADGEIRTIVLRRRLVSGFTGYAQLVRHEGIEALCVTVAKALQLRGSINIQLRLGPAGPMIFEINPRFSSSVVFRHKLGFQDLVWSLQEQILGKKTVCEMTGKPGAQVYRTFDEIICP